MSPTVALAILSWAAMVVLYLALASVQREVRLLRRTVSGLQAVPTSLAPPEAAMVSNPHAAPLTLAPEVAGPTGGIVLAATSTCPLCRVVLDRLAVRSREWGFTATLLTYEKPADWWTLPAGVRVVADADSWQAIAHIDPPALFAVDSAGRVHDLVLPARSSDVDEALAAWHVSDATDHPSPTTPDLTKETTS